MMTYYSWLAMLSIRKTPILSLLMVLAISVGIASCLTIITIYSAISTNPLAHKNDEIAAIQLNAWGDEGGYFDNNGVPVLLTYKDAKALYESGVADQIALHFNGGLTYSRIGADIKSGVEETRLVTRDFFSIFDVELIQGQAWSEQDDRMGERVVVINESMIGRYALGENPIGNSLIIEGVAHTVVGVVSERWNLTPAVYDPQGRPFREPPKAYIPFFQVEQMRIPIWGNVASWRNEDVSSNQAFLNSEVVWIYAWAGFHSRNNKEDFDQFLRSYVQSQKAKGRFPLYQDHYFQSPEQWLTIFNVVTKDDRLLLVMAFSFLLVCLINSTVLLLAKFAKKAPEAGVRRALGASKFSIFVQHLTESMLISILGALLGFVFSWFGLVGVRQLYHDYNAVASISISTYLFAVLLALITGLISGLIPSFKVSRTAPALYLKAE